MSYTNNNTRKMNQNEKFHLDKVYQQINLTRPRVAKIKDLLKKNDDKSVKIWGMIYAKQVFCFFSSEKNIKINWFSLKQTHKTELKTGFLVLSHINNQIKNQ